MLELIHAVAGGGVGAALIWAVTKNPKVFTAIVQALAAILALLVAPFPGERLYGRYKELAVLSPKDDPSAKKAPRKKTKREG
ncbi:MAG TPA: hypothetical protein VHS28_03400 [Chloroflexota bacterium]|nr:hypothetical protein [Chloroflexota bacterium]